MEQKQKAEALAKVELLETQYAQAQQALRDAVDRAQRDAQAKDKRISTLEREKVGHLRRGGCVWRVWRGGGARVPALVCSWV